MITNFKPPASIVAPLLANKNAVISFEIETATEIDKTTGNLTITTETTEIEAICHFSGLTNTQIADKLAGIAVDKQRLYCRLVNPQILPDGIAQKKVGAITFNDGQSGKFEIEKYIQNPYVQGVLGDKVYGFYQKTSG